MTKEFQFRAPTLFDASAKVPVEDELHDAPGAAEHLAKIKKFALWLKSEMVDKGLRAKGPYLDEGGWMIDVPTAAPGGPFVLCIVSGSSGDESLFLLLVTEMGGAPKDVADVIEDILRNASPITDFDGRVTIISPTQICRVRPRPYLAHVGLTLA